MNPFLLLRNYEEFVYTLPLHKHIFPDIKHHRIPAPDMSFTHPNLQALIREIGELLKE